MGVAATGETVLTASLPSLGTRGEHPLRPHPSAGPSQVSGTACPEAPGEGPAENRRASSRCGRLSYESIQVDGKWPLARFLAGFKGPDNIRKKFTSKKLNCFHQ